jgi:hypothetical protein
MFNQLSGFIELIQTFIGKPSGGGPDEICDFPGKRNDGY